MADEQDPASPRRRALAAMIAAPLGVAATSALAASKAAPASLAGRLDALEARRAVEEVLVAYARANDRVDEALLRSCFWPESTHHHGGFQGKSSDFVGFAMKILGGVLYTAHHISNVSVEVKGDRAFSECYYFAHHRRPAKDAAGETDAFFEGRYIDLFERRAGVWKIIQRRGLSDYTAVIPANTPYASWPAGQHSLRAPDEDDYYVMRKAFEGGS